MRIFQIFIGAAALLTLAACSNDSIRIDRYLIETETSECTDDLVLNEPVHIGNKFFSLERFSKVICVSDAKGKLIEAYKLAPENEATHLWTSEASEWSIGTKNTFGPYRSAKQ